MKNKITFFLLALLGIAAFYACKKSFLDVTPQGSLDEATLSTEKGVNKVLLSAYAVLDGTDNNLGVGTNWGSSASNFLFGSIAAGEANKGSDPGDQGPSITNVARHDYTPTNPAFEDRWKALYEGIKRTNTVMEFIPKIPNLSSASQKSLSGQARFLRAWYHFQARITFGKVPYIDEKVDADLASGAVPSVANDVDIFPKILEDAKYAYDNLPAAQDAIGRVNKWTAGALYGKVLMFTKDYANAKTVLTDVVNNGVNSSGVHFALNANYDDNFNLAFDNSKESVFAFQASSNDKANGWNSNWGDLLNLPATGPGGAGFYDPTFYFTNQFKTDALGLPLANPQDNQVFDVFNQAGFTLYTGNIDPRLDWTIGRNGIPYHDWGTYLTSWARDISAGPYGFKKGAIRNAQVGASHDPGVWVAGGASSLNIVLIRFADILLLLADADIEAGGATGLTDAFNIINQIRTRAATGRTVKTYIDPANPSAGFTNTDAAKYKIAAYTVPFATQDDARKALRLERALELGMEGHRFFDLVRWGIAQAELTAFYNYESPLPYQVILKPKPTFDPAQDNYSAVPQNQIDLSKGFLKP